MKHLITTLLIVFALSSAEAQTANDKQGSIVLNPYLVQSEMAGQKSEKALKSKLQQTATLNGMAGSGFDNRFVIAGHIQELEAAMTETTPQKFAVRLNVGIYIGDGLDGTLFSSCMKELKGIGDTKDEAYASAIKKLRPADSDVQTAVQTGKQRILDYYDRISQDIISTAKSSAAAGDYDNAITSLMAIPMSCKSYEQAQKMIAQYGATSLGKQNKAYLSQAQAAWSASPNETGAEQARELLAKITVPSAEVTSASNKLMQEISSRLKAVDDRNAKNAKDIELANINAEKAAYQAAAQVATAYYNAQPKVTYHVYWW